MEQKKIALNNYLNVPGGSIQMIGNNFTIITFNGPDFKTQKWALFSLNQLSIDFSTDTHSKYFFLIKSLYFILPTL